MRALARRRATIASLSRHARLREADDARRRPDVPRPLGLDDGRRVRAEHDDAEQLRAEHGLRAASARPCGRSARSSRRTWAATRSRRSSTSSPGTGRRCSPSARSPTRRCAGCCGRRSTTCSSSRGRGRTAPSRPGCSRSRSRPRRRSRPCSPPPARTSAWSARARWRTGRARRVEGGLHCAIRFPGLEVGTVGGGTTLPYARALARAARLRGRRHGLPLRADRRRGRARARDLGVGGDGDGRLGELLPRAPRARRAALNRHRIVTVRVRLPCARGR